MGYANPAQLSAGIHTRQYSRAFIVDDGAKRVVFVSVDCALMDQVIKTEVRILILIVFKMNTV
jgi:neutral ceramidase